jgi:hypothetical protein
MTTNLVTKLKQQLIETESIIDKRNYLSIEYGIMKLKLLNKDYNSFTNLINSSMKLEQIEDTFAMVYYGSADYSLKFPEYEGKSGLYFIYNELDELIYIGKSQNLGKRPGESFWLKTIYGSKYIRIVPLKVTDDYLTELENDMIYLHKPVCNQTITKKLNMSSRVEYYNLKSVETLLQSAPIIYPKIIDDSECEINVFDENAL